MGNEGPTPATRRARSAPRTMRSTGSALRTLRAVDSSCARPLVTSSATSSPVWRPRRMISTTRSLASLRVMRPREAASSRTSWTRARVRVICSRCRAVERARVVVAFARLAVAFVPEAAAVAVPLAPVRAADAVRAAPLRAAPAVRLAPAAVCLAPAAVCLAGALVALAPARAVRVVRVVAAFAWVVVLAADLRAVVRVAFACGAADFAAEPRLEDAAEAGFLVDFAEEEVARFAGGMVGSCGGFGSGQRRLRARVPGPADGCRSLREIASAVLGAADQPLEQRLLGVAAVLRLIPDPLAVAVEHLGGDLVARMGGQAVQRDRAGTGEVEQRVVDAVGRQVDTAPFGGLGRIAHRHPHVGVDGVGAVRGGVRIVGELDPVELLELIAGRRRDPDGDPGQPSEYRERAGDVVAVTDVGDGEPVQRAERLAQGEQVRERLAGVVQRGEHVDHRHPGMHGERL